MRNHAIAVGLVCVALFAASCFALPPRQFAGACSSDDECEDGLVCAPLAQVNGDDCTEVGKQCSKACDEDAECAELDERALCIVSCDPAVSHCALTG